MKRLTLGSAIAVGLTMATGSAYAQDHCGLSNGKKASGEPIQIGAVVGKTGPEDFSSGARAAAAYFKCVNANGGINGRPIAYTIVDDAWNPGTAAQVATKLVKDIKVVGMVGSTSFVEANANAKLYDAEGVAVIASVGVPRSNFFSRNMVSFNAGPRMSTTGAAQYLVETFKLKNLTCVAPGIPGFGDWTCGGVESYGKSAGVEVKTILFDPAALDGNAIALQVLRNKSDGVVLGMPRGMMFPILAAAEQQDLGKSIKWGVPTSAYHADMPKAIGKYWGDKLYVHMELQPMDNVAPDNKNWKAVMAKYGAKEDPIDTFSQAGYLAASAATQALLGIKGPIDRKAVYDAFKGINDFRTDMLCAPWYFGPGDRHQPNRGGRIAIVTGGGFKTITGCFEAKDGEVSDVLKFEAENGINRH